MVHLDRRRPPTLLNIDLNIDLEAEDAALKLKPAFSFDNSRYTVDIGPRS